MRSKTASISYFMEIVAGIRGFTTVIYILKHLRERFHRSPLRGGIPYEPDFLADLQQALGFSGRTLRRLFAALVDECRALGVRLPPAEGIVQMDGAAATAIRRHLPHNIDEDQIGGESEKVAQVASDFLKAVEDYNSFCPRKLVTLEELRNFVLSRLDEEESRRVESAMHAIQSKYDTYIQHTRSESEDGDLKRLRSIVSLTLHLFEITTHLIHFYERHENDIRSATAKRKLAELVDKGEVLDQAVNFAFRGASRFLAEGKQIALRVIPAYTSVLDLTFGIPEGVKLHVRPAALIAAVVAHHGTPVKMRMCGREIDAESVTEVIYLAASNPEARDASFKGDRRPLEDLRILFEVGLRDDGHSQVVERLPYLRRS